MSNFYSPKKVRILLKELGLAYTDEVIDFSVLKQKPYTDLNPNGRLPTIQDPNTGITLWETGAIIKYLIDTYDKDHKLSFDTTPEKYLADQWLFFQVSGQGPYFGQVAWFDRFHHEKLPSATERYQKEVERVVAVLDGFLADKEWLVGGRISYADLSFVSWNFIAETYPAMHQDGKLFEGGKYPHYRAWSKRMVDRGLGEILSAGMPGADAKAKE